MIFADVLVMASLAQIAGIYTFLLFGADRAAASTSGSGSPACCGSSHGVDLLRRDRGLARTQ